MTHVVTESCILCKYTDCVDVCPVDCFKETPFMLVIDPDECIDCGVCIYECSISAICHEDDIPAEQLNLITLNQRLSESSPTITRSHTPLLNADFWRHISNKALLLDSDTSNTQF